MNNPHPNLIHYRHVVCYPVAMLTPVDRMVFSASLTRTRWNLPDLPAVGLDPRTVKTAVARLKRSGYLSEDGQTLPPPFASPIVSVPQRAEAKGWAEGIATFRVWVPQKGGGLSAHAAVLYGLLHSYAEGRPHLLGQTFAGLAKLTNTDRQTMTREVAALVDVGLIRFHKGTRVISTFAVAFTGEVRDGLFEESRPAETTADDYDGLTLKQNSELAPVQPEPAKPKPAVWESMEGAEHIAPILRKIMGEDPSNRWLQNNWPVEVLRVWWPHFSDYVQADHGAAWVASIFRAAREIHGKNGKSQTCANLCLSMLKKRIETAGHGFEPMGSQPDPEPDAFDVAAAKVDAGKAEKSEDGKTYWAKFMEEHKKRFPGWEQTTFAKSEPKPEPVDPLEAVRKELAG